MSKTELKSLHDVYVPRHIRLNGGLFFTDHKIPVACHEVSEDVPILSDSGSVVASKKVVVSIPAGVSLSKFSVDDFKIDHLQSAGVSLQEINFELMSRNGSANLVQKAIELGFLSEEFSQNFVHSSESSESSKSVKNE